MAIGASWYINNRGRAPESSGDVNRWIDKKAKMSSKKPKNWIARPVSEWKQFCKPPGWHGYLASMDEYKEYADCRGIYEARKGSSAKNLYRKLVKRFGKENIFIVDRDKVSQKQIVELRKKHPYKVVMTTHKPKGADWGKIGGLMAISLAPGIYAAATGAGGATAAATAGGQQAATAGAATKAATTAATKATATTAVKGGLATKAAGGAAAAGLSKVVQDKPVKPHVVRQLEDATEVVDAIGALYQSTTYAASPRRPEGRPINRAVEPDSGSDIFLRRAGAGEAGDKGLPLVMIGGIAAVIAAVMLT